MLTNEVVDKADLSLALSNEWRGFLLSRDRIAARVLSLVQWHRSNVGI